LAAILLDPVALHRVEGLLSADDFYRMAHRLCYETMLQVAAKGLAIDTVTLADALRALGKLDQVGGAAGIAELLVEIGSAANVLSHARIVKEQATLRRLVALGLDLTARAQAQESAAALLALAEETVFALAGGARLKSFNPLVTALNDTLAYMDLLAKQKIALTGIPTGFPSLDRLTAGWQATDLILIAGRTSMGKTSLALACAVAAAKAGKRVGFASLEMGKRALSFRLLAAESGLDVLALRTGRLYGADWPSLAAAAEVLERIPFILDDSADLTVSELRTMAWKERLKSGLDLLVLDYLQLLRPEEGDTREREVAAMSRSLKLLAKELEIPVLVLSQLSRRCDDREDKRPILSDLRDSGSLEQDADVVMFLYRDEVYEPETADKGIAELLVRKQRNGPTGELRLKWLASSATFEDLPEPR